MIRIYTAPSCASCRKVKSWLNENQIPYVEKNIFSTLLKESELRELLERSENGTDDIISKRSKIIKENDIELTKLHQRILSNTKTDYEEKLFDAIMSFRSSMMFVNPAFVGNEQYITFEKRQALYNFYCNYKNLVLKSSDSDSFKFESKIKIYSEV